jgi:hypothetical protein
MMKLTCKTCQKEKSIRSYYRRKESKTGHYPNCKDCVKLEAKLMRSTPFYRSKIRTSPQNRFSRYKFSAKERGLEFKLTFEDMKLFSGVPCNYCGERLEVIGIDRVDNSKGYTLDNSVPCCMICNRMKTNYTENKFFCHVEKIYKHQAEQMDVQVKLLKVL